MLRSCDSRRSSNSNNGSSNSSSSSSGGGGGGSSKPTSHVAWRSGQMHLFPAEQAPRVLATARRVRRRPHRARHGRTQSRSTRGLPSRSPRVSSTPPVASGAEAPPPVTRASRHPRTCLPPWTYIRLLQSTPRIGAVRTRRLPKGSCTPSYRESLGQMVRQSPASRGQRAPYAGGPPMRPCPRGGLL